MKHPKIRLALRVVVGESSASLWEKYIFEDTYKEYVMQQQRFNDKENPVNTFRELLVVNPAADQLHFLTGIAAENYIAQFKNRFYRYTDILGSTFFPFTGYRLDIINTDVTDISKHKIGITFFSPLFTFLGMMNNAYLVSENTEENKGYETVMFPVQPQFSVCYYEEGSQEG